MTPTKKKSPLDNVEVKKELENSPQQSTPVRLASQASRLSEIEDELRRAKILRRKLRTLKYTSLLKLKELRKEDLGEVERPVNSPSPLKGGVIVGGMDESSDSDDSDDSDDSNDSSDSCDSSEGRDVDIDGGEGKIDKDEGRFMYRTPDHDVRIVARDSSFRNRRLGSILSQTPLLIPPEKMSAKGIAAESNKDNNDYYKVKTGKTEDKAMNEAEFKLDGNEMGDQRLADGSSNPNTKVGIDIHIHSIPFHPTTRSIIGTNLIQEGGPVPLVTNPLYDLRILGDNPKDFEKGRGTKVLKGVELGDGAREVLREFKRERERREAWGGTGTGSGGGFDGGEEDEGFNYGVDYRRDEREIERRREGDEGGLNSYLFTGGGDNRGRVEGETSIFDDDEDHNRNGFKQNNNAGSNDDKHNVNGSSKPVRFATPVTYDFAASQSSLDSRRTAPLSLLKSKQKIPTKPKAVIDSTADSVMTLEELEEEVRAAEEAHKKLISMGLCEEGMIY